ncbi:hypothetical protein D3OALGA1CA_5821 [Olavius algarvensis associated proteobacterium Delta 3]|nr:hypothetical protein D3OALGA1CA_5821 [Olavius algarvensis associated proteobacterium Delta 3]
MLRCPSGDSGGICLKNFTVKRTFFQLRSLFAFRRPCLATVSSFETTAGQWKAKK